MKILMITGWGLGTAVLTPFVEQLRQQYQVEVWDIFDPNVESILAEKVRQASSFDVLMGWSLGGQLAIYLANEIFQQTRVAKPVIACMSNPCFVANKDWQQAMPETDLEQFLQAARLDMLTTLKRFSHLVCMGAKDARQRVKYLQSQLSLIDLNHQEKHLYLLKQLDLVKILKTCSTKILFIFSNQDSLVPCQVSIEPVFYQQSLIKVKEIQAAHDAILFDTELVLTPILDFLDDLSVASAR
ncbi:alpha/beta hydrolase (plasmid) [Acinetobacter variabilis]|uniref:alpha/beta hydrolase n=1 Tax=Acinetobacter TaxID=469 RepID=UPI00044652DF|nr:alpha/beta hydrolase [Acinetobacter variabilis]EXA63643.1 alpha/beta hydrolase family protein [Acinetobacter baumannii 348935]QXR20928.1 alpha/beta hydrolase [Acinetobacter variabilis]